MAMHIGTESEDDIMSPINTTPMVAVLLSSAKK